MTIPADPDKKPTAPTMSPVTFERFIETHRRTLPGRIDRSVMPTMAGGDQTKIISALHFMGLTDPRTDVPTGLFARMKDAGEDAAALKAAWGDVLREAYPTAFTPPFNLMTATQGQLNENFTAAFGITGDSVRKATAFFISLARVAGIPLSGYFRQTRVRTVGSGGNGGKGGGKGAAARAATKAAAAAAAAARAARKDAQPPTDLGAIGALAATWRLPNGVIARLYVDGHLYSEPKKQRDELLKVVDRMNELDATNPASREAEPVTDGAAES
jgi:hypothetical protein